MTNYEKIREMPLEQMARLLARLMAGLCMEEDDFNKWAVRRDKCFVWARGFLEREARDDRPDGRREESLPMA